MSKFAVIFCMLCVCSGCAVDGRLYTNKTIPYSTDFDRTSVGLKKCTIDDFKVKEPFSGLGVSAEWMNDSVLQKAKESGITTIHFADLKVLSVWFGIYTKKTLVVYGE